MAESSLADRLREHAEAFDGLLSLIPAKHYYGEDNSDQWRKKKQTKEQAAAARRAKLDPDSIKSAKDVMDERAKKRKLEEIQDSENSDIEGIEKELPKQGLKQHDDKRSKKPKTINDSETNENLNTVNPDTADDAAKETKAEAKREKQQKKKEKQAKKAEQRKSKEKEGKKEPEPQTQDSIEHEPRPDGREEVDAREDSEMQDDEMGHFEAEGLEDERAMRNSSASPSPAPQSPTFDNPTEPSANSSTSSVIPPAQAPKHIKLPTDPELLKARLAARIEALRAARKADGPDGAPARNRQELMEARRKKEELRRAHKKELRAKAKAEEEARREVALASARDSPASLLSPAIHSPDHNFSFGRVAFADGQELANDLTSLVNVHKKKGPQDPATALMVSEKKRQRLAALDDEKRADIEEKELWLNAKKRAHGEKVRDDTSLLKKALKRKEKAKKKSEKAWNERKEGVEKSQAMRQKKREENLRKRREEKGSKGKGKGRSVPSKGKKKVKSRPGFEGSFTAGGGRK
ncbi:surfeit locus protein 6-domain-containing protein [Xylogone sp. PMI_703]|nr:surfeit locus protein 6-domain-containing protein [Xylogone sp. PMI_703]